MKEWTPVETGWPSGVLLIGVVICLWLCRRELALPRRDRWKMAGLMGLAFVVRWWWLPVTERHFPDGHEADYFDRFQGLVEPTRGGTVMYPSMQWLWFSLGKLLPHEPWIPSLVMVGIGCAGIYLLVLALQKLTIPEVGWTAGALLSLHPVHAAWSSSAYNVILPFSLGMLGLAAAAAYVIRHRPPESLLWLCFFALALGVATRLDSVVLAGPVLMLLITIVPKDAPWRRVMRERAMHLGAVVVSGGILALCVHPLIFPAQVPGSGERELSLGINWNLVDVHLPFDGPVGLLVIFVGAGLASRRWPILTAAMILGGVGNHLLMATFNDFADRHALMSHAALVTVIGAGAWAIPGSHPAGRWSRGVAILAGVICVLGLLDMRDRFYGSDDHFNTMLAEEEWGALPRMELEEASTEDGQMCGWVSESAPVQVEAGLSHFNLVDPIEAEDLRGEQGCLRWCADVQDWRWSSRSVRDRALRLIHLYQLDAIGVVGEPDGYQCLVIDVGERSASGEDRIPPWLGPRRSP